MSKFSFPSLETLIAGFLAVLRRFPLAMLFAVTGAWAAIQTTFPEHRFADTNWLRLIMSCNLVMVFSQSVSPFAAFLRTVPWVSWLLRVFVAVMGMAHAFHSVTK